MSKKKDSLKPWLSRPTINRSVTLPLTRPLTQRLSNLNEFHPNELDPFLLFDARDSMIGTLENPTLDLDPSKPDTLNVITATRAGTATFTDANGNIATASPNTVRVDYVDSVPMILVEPSATNLVTYSEDFSNSAWIKSAAGTGVAPAVTLNAAESPDGTQNATKVVFDSGSGTSSGDQSMLEDFFNTTGGASYTQSIYLKGENGGEKILLRHAGNSSYTTVTLTTDWARYEVTETASGSSGYYTIGLRQGLGGVVINSSITVYAYGAQVETGSATSLIRTSGSTAQRAADDLEISGSAFSSFYNGAEGTFYLEAIDHDPTSGTHSFLRGQSEHRDFLFKYNGTSIHSFDGSTGVSQSGISANQLFRAAVSYKSGARTLSLNGTSPADVSLNTNWTTADRLRIGNGNAVVANTHVRRVIFWPYHKDNL